MKKIIKIIFIVMVLTISSCATGTVLVTGQQREATNPENIVIYSEPPQKYDVIGIVTASSDSGWNEQGDLNLAMAKLKQKAASVGANGIILESVGTSNSGGTIIYGVIVPTTAKNVSGKAIYVYD